MDARRRRRTIWRAADHPQVAFRAPMSPVRAIILAAATACLMPAAALAAPARIPPRILLEGGSVSGLRLGASPADELVAVIARSSRPADPALTARVRGADGRIGAAEEISRANADLPMHVRFSPGGDLFLAWGVGDPGAPAEHAFRPRGGLFSAPAAWPAGKCGRYVAVGYGPGGFPQAVCSAEVGTVSPKIGVVLLGATSAPGFVYSAPLTLQGASSYSDYMPRFDVGPDGTRAAVWTTSVTGQIDTVISVKLAVAAPGAGFGAPQTVTSVTTDSGLESVAAAGVTVLADGRVAVLFNRTDALTATSAMGVAIRSVAGAIQSRTLPSSSGGWASVSRDANDAVIGWSDRSYGSQIITVRVAKLASGASEPSLSNTQVLDESVASLADLGLGVAANGSAVLMRSVPTAGGNRTLAAWTRPTRTATFSGPVTVATATSISFAQLAVDRFGSALAVWGEPGAPGSMKVMLGGLDAAGPSIGSRTVPSRLVKGRPGSFSVRASDPSGVASVRWAFGDRSSASGSAVRHAYARPGRYRVTVVATDRAGKRSSSSASLSVVR